MRVEYLDSYCYDKGGLLQSISQNEIIYITNISYNPKGQRENIYYGNNTKTRYDYNPLNFRLERILTTRMVDKIFYRISITFTIRKEI